MNEEIRDQNGTPMKFYNLKINEENFDRIQAAVGHILLVAETQLKKAKELNEPEEELDNINFTIKQYVILQNGYYLALLQAHSTLR